MARNTICGSKAQLLCVFASGDCALLAFLMKDKGGDGSGPFLQKKMGLEQSHHGGAERRSEALRR